MLSSILITPDGIVTEVNDSQEANALIPITDTEDGMLIVARLLHLEKASIPIDVRFDLIFTDFKLEKLVKEKK